MAYKLVVTEHAEDLLDNLVYHLLNHLKSEQAARHLLEGIDMDYIIVFNIEDDTVNVAGILHQLENYPQKM